MQKNKYSIRYRNAISCAIKKISHHRDIACDIAMRYRMRYYWLSHAIKRYRIDIAYCDKKDIACDIPMMR